MTARTGAEWKPNEWGRVRDFFIWTAAVCDRLTWAASLLACLFLTAAVLAIVVLRYGFGQGYIELQDAATYAFAVLAILSVPVALARDGHVRVEVVSERLPAGYRRAADALALVLFLLPVFGLMVWAWWPQVTYAWSIREGALETGGLPGLFLVKTVLPVAAVLTMVQGVAAVLRKAPDDGA